MSSRPINADAYKDSISDIWQYIRQTLSKSNNLDDEPEMDNWSESEIAVTQLFLHKGYTTDTVDLTGAMVTDRLSVLLECVFMLKPDIREFVLAAVDKAEEDKLS